MKIAAGCFAVFILLAGLFCGFLYYRWQTRDPLAGMGYYTTTTRTVDAPIYILPGKWETPSGYTPFLGWVSSMDASLCFAAVGPTGLTRQSVLQPGQLLIMMMTWKNGWFPGFTVDQYADKLRERLTRQKWAVASVGSTLSQELPVSKVVSGRQAEIQTLAIEVPSSAPLLEHRIHWSLPEQYRDILLVVDGPRSSFDTAGYEKLLESLDLSPPSPPAASPRPGKTPR